MRHARPRDLDEALALLAQQPWRVLAGGTDFYPAQGTRPLRDDVLDINGLDALRGIDASGGDLVIGARATWREIAEADLPPALDGLRQAAREVGSIQIQNVATVAGNLCNASPAADGIPPLLAVDAGVELRSARGTRTVPLQSFVTGNRRTALRPDELLTAIRIPATACRGTSRFLKLGIRRYLVISIAMVGVRVAVRDGLIDDVAVAVGACSEVAVRLASLEGALRGEPAEPAFVEACVAEADLAGLSPIDDVRASAAYRLSSAREIVRRALLEAMAGRRSLPGSVAA
jgi:CO/xanthine dehydrogenase FAD-binding subunit